MNTTPATTEAAPLPAVATPDPSTSLIALPDPATVAVFAEQMLGLEDTLSFDRIKVGTRSFEIPTGDGDEIEAATTIEGVILHHHPSSVLFLDSLDDKPEGSSNRPDAWSSDGITQVVPEETIAECQKRGLAIPNTVLASCPYNQFGSDPKGGRGKWTQNRHSLYVVRAGERFPKHLSLSATSLKPFGNYIGKRLGFDRGLLPSHVVTRFNVTAESAGNKEWGVVGFSLGATLEPGDRESVAQLALMLAPLFSRYAEAVVVAPAEAMEGTAVDASEFVPAEQASAAMEPDPNAVF